MPATYQISTAIEISHQNMTARGSGACRFRVILFFGFPSCRAIYRILRPLQRSQQPGRAVPAVAYDHTARDTVEALGEFVCQDHGIRKLAHHADLEFFVLALQTEVKREILDRKIGR